MDVLIDGKKYVVVDEREVAELNNLIRFSLEAETFWKNRFLYDSAKNAWNEGMYEDGDEEAPFFSEAFLYNLLGKEDARTVLAIIRRLCVLSGVDFR